MIKFISKTDYFNGCDSIRSIEIINTMGPRVFERIVRVQS